MIIIGIAIWTVCAVLHYYIFRKGMQKGGCMWTVSDRRFAIFFGGLLGPLALIASILFYFVSYDGDVPARW